MSTRLNSESMQEIRSLTKAAAAAILDGRARELEIESKQAFVEIGLICLAVEDKMLFEHMNPPYSSFGAWVSNAMPTQVSTAYAAKSAIRALREFVPIEALNDMPRCNIETLGKCSSEVARNPEMLEKAKTLSQNEFVRAVDGKYPDQHIEERDFYRFAPSKSQRETIDAAIAAVRLLLGDEQLTREECLWHLGRTFLDDHEDELKAKIAEAKKATAKLSDYALPTTAVQ